MNTLKEMNPSKHRFRGNFSYYGDVLTLYTTATNKQRAKRSMLHKLAYKLGLENISFLTTYFNGSKDNYEVIDLGAVEDD